MQNPFTRLKHYKPDKVHPKENHATECLAACLHFSDELRESFVEFLFAGMAVKPPSATALEIRTQQSVGEFGIPDLVLEEEGQCQIAVEIKVDAQLTERQVGKYGRWLGANKNGERFLFSLEKNPVYDFDIECVSGVRGRRRKWRDLYAWFAGRQNNFETTAAKVIASLCGYLEDEGIVSTWTPSQILAYGPGLRAKSALSHCFSRVTDALQAVDAEYATEERFRAGEWPRLEVARSDWRRIFGPGYLGRVWAFYQAEGVWESNVSRFYFCVFTWNDAFESDWAVAKKQLKSWAQKLAAAEFSHSTSFKRGDEIEGVKGLDKLEQTPRVAEAWLKDEKRSFIDAATITRLSDDQLVAEITARIVELSKIVSSLG